MKKLYNLTFILIGLILLLGVFTLPEFGKAECRNIAKYYLDSGLKNTGSTNIINAIVWDFRGYDTLIEEAVLFTAVVGMVLITKKG